jgi:transcriptional regulator of arginine metabolism
MADLMLRRKLILEWIAARPIATQAELVGLLKKRGVSCTQASVSRDIAELGLVKSAGHYTLPPAPPDGPHLDAQMARRIRRVRAAGDSLVVVQTHAGEASLVAIAIDNEAWPCVVGTVAGDDTVFIACDGSSDQRKTVKRLLAILRETAGA